MVHPVGEIRGKTVFKLNFWKGGVLQKPTAVLVAPLEWSQNHRVEKDPSTELSSDRLGCDGLGWHKLDGAWSSMG